MTTWAVGHAFCQSPSCPRPNHGKPPELDFCARCVFSDHRLKFWANNDQTICVKEQLATRCFGDSICVLHGCQTGFCLASLPNEFIWSQYLSLDQQPREKQPVLWFNLGLPYFLPRMIREGTNELNIIGWCYSVVSIHSEAPSDLMRLIM